MNALKAFFLFALFIFSFVTMVLLRRIEDSLATIQRQVGVEAIMQP